MEGVPIEEALHAYQDAGRTLEAWAAAASAHALLRAAVRSGIFDRARSPCTPAQIAAATELSEELAADVCVALHAHGVFEREGDAFRLAAEFAVLAAANAPQSLPSVLGWHSTRIDALESLAEPMPSLDEKLAVAQAVTTDPASALRGWAFSYLGEAIPEWIGPLERGGRHAEFGCGVGGLLLGLLISFPRATAAGIELDAEVLGVARRRAAELGLTDRVAFWHGDARDFEANNAFDTMYWAQFFFPIESRREVLATAFRALKPGGYLLMPAPNRPPESHEALRSPVGRAWSLAQLYWHLQRVPVSTVERLCAEVEAAGFAFVRVVEPPIFVRGLLVRYLLVRRP